jgi:hypothetical protein
MIKHFFDLPAHTPIHPIVTIALYLVFFFRLYFVSSNCTIRSHYLRRTTLMMGEKEKVSVVFWLYIYFANKSISIYKNIHCHYYSLEYAVYTNRRSLKHSYDEALQGSINNT